MPGRNLYRPAQARLFHLQRSKDSTGVSGTGKIAVGVQFPSGRVVLQWQTGTPSITIFDSLDDMTKVHGHAGDTKVVWRDGLEKEAGVKRLNRMAMSYLGKQLRGEPTSALLEQMTASGRRMAQNLKRRGLPQDTHATSHTTDRQKSKMMDYALRAFEKRAYRLQGHTDVQGLRVAIENRKGSVRKGKDSDGHEWRTKMRNPYGYIVGTRGADGEPVDAYVGPHKDAKNAYVVHQHNDDGKGYDEDKIILQVKSKKEAKELYLKHYDDPKFLGPISIVSMERLKELVASKRRLVKISAMLDELEKIAEPPPPEGVSAAAWDRHLQHGGKLRTIDRVRKAGPGLGAGVGLIAGLAAGKRGRRVRRALAGLGTGATLGWTPDLALSAVEGLRGQPKRRLSLPQARRLKRTILNRAERGS